MITYWPAAPACRESSHQETNMEILEDRDQWLQTFQAGWLKRYQETGEINWRIYNLPRHSQAPSGPGIDVSRSRLILISSAGAYLPHTQMRFDDTHDLGDYTIRLIPTNSAPEAISFAHTHYDHTAVNLDQQVLLPLAHLRDLVADGVIGELAPAAISFMGYQPIATRLVDETVPTILEAVAAQKADAALLVPS
jgi:D-proline reductase (dithiol) PrdB